MKITRTLIAFTLLLAFQAFAQQNVVPQLITYQGKLVDVGGAALPNGSYSLAFKLFDAPTDGTLVWGQTYTAPVTEGVFSVALGAAGGTSVPGAVEPDIRFAFGAPDRFLQVEVLSDENGVARPEPLVLLPRQQMGAVPYAAVAITVPLSLSVGSIAMHHTYNGLVGVPRGWMICDGAAISQANYDSLHGAGAWGTDSVESSPLAGKQTPDLVNRYAVGTTSTTWNGTGSTPAVGNLRHTVNLSHSHTVNAHRHQWIIENSSSENYSRRSWNSSGNQVDIGNGQPNIGRRIVMNTASEGMRGNYYTSSESPGTSSSLSSSQSIQPHSVQVLHIIKVR